MILRLVLGFLFVCCWGCYDVEVTGESAVKNWVNAGADDGGLVKPARRIKLVVDSSRGVKRHALYGFNQPFPQLDISVHEMLGLKYVNTFPLDILRFPGGSHGNFYHWGDDRFDAGDLDEFWDKKNRYRLKIYRAYGKEGHQLGLNAFVEWILKTGTEPLFVLNVITQPNTSRLIGVIEDVIGRGVKLRFCELGNELYYYTKEKDIRYKESTAEIMQRIRRLTKELRAHFPGLKIGIPVWYGGDWKKGLVWNSGIRENGLDFDACAVHAYVDFGEVGDRYVGSEPERFVREGLNNIIYRISTDFPEKEIWITEWNIIDKPEYQVGKTLFGAIYAADFFVETLRDSCIAMALQHCLLGKSFGVLDIARKNNGLIVNRHYPHYLWKEVGSFIKGFNKTGAVHARYQKELINLSSEPIKAQFFVQGKKLGVMVINKSHFSWVIENVYFDGNQENKGEILTITGPSLSHIIIRDNAFFPLIQRPYMPDSEIPPFSINFLKFDST